MKSFLAVFKHKNFSLLWLAQIISQFGERVNQMALIGLVADKGTGTAIDLAKLMTFTIIPVFILGPVAGVFVDRWDKKTTLFVCDFLRATLVLSLPFILMHTQSMIPVYGVVFLVFCLSRFYVPAKMSIIPDLVDPKGLIPANSLVSVTGMIAFVIGCAFGGVLVEKVGAKNSFIWGGVTFLISGSLIAALSKKLMLRFDQKALFDTGREMLLSIQKTFLQEVKEGFTYFFSHKDIRFVMNTMFILFAAAGAIYVVIIVFIQQAFGSVTKHLGFLAVTLGVGLFIGAILYGRFGSKRSNFKTIFISLVAGGIMMILFTVSVQYVSKIYLASILAFILGVVIGPTFIAANTIIHQVSEQDMRGRVFSSLEIVMHFGFLATMFISAGLSQYIDHFWILVTVGGVFMCVGLWGLIFHKKDMSY